MGEYRCMICDDKLACRAIDEELEKGMTGAAIARLMTLRGFKVTDTTVNSHNKHRKPTVLPGVAKRGSDFAIMVRDKAAEMFENGDLDLADKHHAPGIAAGLKAQSELNKQDNKQQDRKLTFILARALAAGPEGFRAPPELTAGDDDEDADDDDTIEGTAVEVD